MADHPLVDRQFLEKLERLALRWQKSFAGLVGGQAPSRHAGSGQEFLDHRQFHHGDDLRSVNWRAYLRFEKLFMKMFHIEPRIPVRLMLDVSRSMSTAGNSKFHYARRLTAALCYVGLVRLESINVLPFHERLEDAFICSGGRHRFGPVVDFLTRLEPSGTTCFNDSVRQLTSKYPQRGLLIVISDFLGDESFERSLELAADLGHELFLVQLWDEEDRTPPWTGSLEIVDAESGETRQIEFDKEARKRYTSAFDDYARTLQRVAASSSGRYAGVSTKIPVEDAIFGPLSQVGGIE